ncbi:unnamed protein product [marine sediment metagenome]|uniref:Uncharacterized protein n=1 Tax=marine sediment metagenome TaxID=412755 RepID=X1PEX8_9ZZZZ
MEIVCAWCQRKIGERPPLEDKSISHGICDKCLSEHFPHAADKILGILGDEKERAGGNPMTPEDIDQVATKVAAKVLEEVSPSVLDPGGRGMLLHFCEHAIEGAGLVVNEARARATPCNCFTYNGREYAFSPGVIGLISGEKNPEQMEAFCKAGKTYEVKPGIKERFELFASAAEEAHKGIEEIPKGERLEPWLTAMGRELEKRGIEV